MIILRQKSFGKYDKQLAKEQGISVEQLRQNRAGYNATGTVHDRINLRSDATAAQRAGIGGPSSESRATSLNNKARAQGYTNANVKRVNADLKLANKVGGNKMVTGEVVDMMNQQKAAATNSVQNAQYFNKIKAETRKPLNITKSIPQKSLNSVPKEKLVDGVVTKQGFLGGNKGKLAAGLGLAALGTAGILATKKKQKEK